MGKSAKFLKRNHKKVKSSTSAGATATTTAVSASNAIHSHVDKAKKKANLIGKTAKARSSSGVAATPSHGDSGHGVLGGADYVSLMMGGRRKAKAEALKLPRDDDTMNP